MNFTEIAKRRQSCRSFDKDRAVEDDKINAIIESAAIAPSACNSQPYLVTVCRGEKAREAALCCTGMGMNKFAPDAPVVIVISEDSYNPTAALGAKAKGLDYRSIDIGILAAYITSEATAQGLDSCILGWLDDAKLRRVVGFDKPVRLVITIGYASEGYALREKKRKKVTDLVKELK
jgi:nitroreductase